MELGVVKISYSLIALIIGGTIGWILLRIRYVPLAMLRLKAAVGPDVPLASSRVVVMRSLSSLTISLAICPLLVVLIYGYAQWRIEGSAGHPEKVQSVIEARALLEAVLQPMTAVSLELWIFALLAVSAIWIAARRSASRRSWERAIETRRRAHLASLSTLPDEEILAEAYRQDPEGFARIRAAATVIESRNRQQIKKTETARMFTLGESNGEAQPTSIAELRNLIAELETHATSLEEVSQDFPQGTPGVDHE